MSDSNGEEDEKDYARYMLNLLKPATINLMNDAAVQIQSLPDFCDIPFELADDFSYCSEYLIGKYRHKLGDRQIDLIGQIVSIFDELSGPDNEVFWDLKGLKSDPNWEKIRQLAKELHDIMKWPSDDLL